MNNRKVNNKETLNSLWCRRYEVKGIFGYELVLVFILQRLLFNQHLLGDVLRHTDHLHRSAFLRNGDFPLSSNGSDLAVLKLDPIDDFIRFS